MCRFLQYMLRRQTSFSVSLPLSTSQIMFLFLKLKNSKKKPNILAKYFLLVVFFHVFQPVPTFFILSLAVLFVQHAFPNLLLYYYFVLVFTAMLRSNNWKSSFGRHNRVHEKNVSSHDNEILIFVYLELVFWLGAGSSFDTFTSLISTSAPVFHLVCH